MYKKLYLLTLCSFLTSLSGVSAMGNSYRIAVKNPEGNNVPVIIECNGKEIKTTTSDLKRIAATKERSIDGLADFSVELKDHQNDPDFAGLTSYDNFIKILGPGISFGIGDSSEVYVGTNLDWQNGRDKNDCSLEKLTISSPDTVYFTPGGKGLICKKLDVSGYDVNLWSNSAGLYSSPEYLIGQMDIHTKRSIGLNAKINVDTATNLTCSEHPFIHFERSAILKTDKLNITGNSTNRELSNCTIDGSVTANTLTVNDLEYFFISRDFQCGSWKGQVKAKDLTCDINHFINRGSLAIENGANIKVLSQKKYEPNYIEGAGSKNIHLEYAQEE